MPMKSFRGALASATVASLLAIAAATPAAATVLTDANLVSPGVFYGTGNANGHFTVDINDAVELGIRGHIYQQAASAPVGNLYAFGLGQTISVDFSVHEFDGSISGFPILTIFDVANNNNQSVPLFFLPDNATNAPGTLQNSERLSFSFMDAFYNSNQNNTFNVTLAYAPGGGQSVTAVLQQGSGAAVPEPATWGLMILGLGGVGATLRRARKAAAFA